MPHLTRQDCRSTLFSAPLSRNKAASRWLGCGAIALLLLAGGRQNAEADLIVDFYGVPGSGETAVIFSGSTVAAASNFFRVPGSGSNANMWQNIGSFTAIQDQNRGFSSGSAFISANGGTPTQISTLYFDNDGGTLDDFTIGAASQFNFNGGDTISWTGTITTNSDIGSLFDIALPAQFTSSNWDGGGAALGLELNIFPTAIAIPEPTTALVLLGLVTSAFFRRRRRLMA